VYVSFLVLLFSHGLRYAVRLLYATGATVSSLVEFVKHNEWQTCGAHYTLDTHSSCKYTDGANHKQSVILREVDRGAYWPRSMGTTGQKGMSVAVPSEATAQVPRYLPTMLFPCRCPTSWVCVPHRSCRGRALDWGGLSPHLAAGVFELRWIEIGRREHHPFFIFHGTKSLTT